MSESTQSVSREEALAALDAVRATQHDVSERLVIPAGYDAIYSVACGAIVLSIACINAPSHGIALITLGLVLLVASAATLAAIMRWFRRVNGFWLSGITPRRARWVAWTAGVVCGIDVFLASLAANAGLWGFVGVSVVATIVLAYTLSRLWLTVYRAETRAAR